MKTIFISSVVTGFEDYHEAARRAVEITHNHPVMCEQFGARPQNSKTACLGEVEQCDVISKWCVEDQHGQEGLTVTEFEWMCGRWSS